MIDDDVIAGADMEGTQTVDEELWKTERGQSSTTASTALLSFKLYEDFI